MSLFNPLLDVGLSLLFFIGSISIGYAGVRLIYPPVKTWKGWKRVGSGALIGMTWAGAIIFTTIPATGGKSFPVSSFAEFFCLIGLGWLLLLGIFSLTTRLVHRLIGRRMALFPTGATQPSSFQDFPPSMDRESDDSPKENTSMIKPSVWKAPPDSKTLPKSVMEEPLLENDVLGFMKEEEEKSGRKK